MMIAPAAIRFLVSVASYGGMKPSNASAPGGRQIDAVNVVFERDGNAMQWPAQCPAARSRSRSSAPGSAGVYVDRRLQQLLIHAEPRQIHRDELT